MVSQTRVAGGFLPVLRNHLQTPALAGSWIQTEDSSDTGLSHPSPGLQQQMENPVTFLVLRPANQPNRNPPGVCATQLSRGKCLLAHPLGIRRGLPAARLRFSFHLNQKQNQPRHLKERRGVTKHNTPKNSEVIQGVSILPTSEGVKPAPFHHSGDTVLPVSPLSP